MCCLVGLWASKDMGSVGGLDDVCVLWQGVGITVGMKMFVLVLFFFLIPKKRSKVWSLMQLQALLETEGWIK